MLLNSGSEDPIMGPAPRPGLCAALPQAEVRIVAALGHHPLCANPAAVAAAINRFLPAPET